ncbi:DUF427 domain-containing protein [Aquimarina litoralis]|uniref:DUF427 domain-containing protein n=1 Tax=Aquimarina litoralis TaxID=584605 RepID=A0ABP3TTG9_9FLAO
MNWLDNARNHWKNRGDKKPPFAIEPKKGQRSVWDFPRPPIIEKVNKPVLVKDHDHIIADSKNALAVLETASPPTYYIPKSDVNISTLILMQTKTSFCEWKGKAIYYALRTNPYQPIAWSYLKPFPEFEALKGYIAFYPQYLQCYVDGDLVKAQNSKFYAGWITPDLVGPFKGEPGTEGW